MSDQHDVTPAVISKVAAYLGSSEASVQRKGPVFSSSVKQCSCGHELDFYDFVKTAFDTGIHAKKYMSDFFDSNMKMTKEMQVDLICTECGKHTSAHVFYRYGGPHTCTGS